MSQKQIVILTEDQVSKLFNTIKEESKPTKKVIKIKESDVVNIVKNIIKEQRSMNEIGDPNWAEKQRQENGLSEDEYKKEILLYLEQTEAGEKLINHVLSGKVDEYISRCFNEFRSPKITANHIRDKWYGV